MNLTPKQSAVMTLLVDEGLKIFEIAARQGVGVSTISTHLGRARLKLGARTMEQAVAFFERERLKGAT